LDASGPVSLTLAARIATLDRPATLAERLPKALIHRNVPGQPIHGFIQAFDDAWRDAASIGVFGARQRWTHAAAALAASGWPLMGRATDWRRGELTVPWSAVSG